MNRKEKDELIQMAFGEGSTMADFELKKFLGENPELRKEVELLQSMKVELMRLREVPECQLSVERVRDAVLREEIRSRASWRRFVLASPPVAACIALFAIWQSNSGSSRAKPEIWVNPVAVKTNAESEMDPKPNPGSASLRVATANVSGDSTPGMEATGPSPRRHNGLRHRSASLAAYHTEPILSSGPVVMKGPVFTVPEAPPMEAKAQPPVVVIGSTTDANTGANIANEVENASDVVIGG